ncbi:MAG: helix-turn-helix transcriptional regulator [Alphaproteobacteria bacterium]|jgi:DNA-binding CsgD family transcriptional regulator|nr:helix-turn-helix transcriptional regulator [Alphaproteobacteria bacterium]
MTITQQHDIYCDSFVFASQAGNEEVNNFYINKKTIFEEFICGLYKNFQSVIDRLSDHTFVLPDDRGKSINKVDLLAPRQRDCGILLVEGKTTKEIAKILNISPRTVEEHIDVLKAKFEATNRAQLSYSLRQYL